MKKVLSSLCCLILLSTFTANAGILNKYLRKNKTKAKTAMAPAPTNYDRFLQGVKMQKGFIDLFKKDNRLYFDFPKSLMGKDMLLASTVSSISDNTNALVGSKPTQPMLICFKRDGNRLNMLLIDKEYISESKDTAFQKALNYNNTGSIFASFRIQAFNKDSTRFIVDMTDFFVSDQKELRPFDPYSNNTMGGAVERFPMFQPDKSYLGQAKTFDNNLSVKSVLSYKYSLNMRGRMIAKEVPFTAEVTRSILLLPDKPYQPRPIDSRIGIFSTEKLVFDPQMQKTYHVYFANRWRLEPKDTAAYKAGKLVEVKKPIVFYIDPAIPKQWQSAVYDAVNKWQRAFEKIGFKNAIMAKPYPTNDPSFDPDNIKYSCIRYMPIAEKNAVGPSWVDPRSGEIVNASVYFYHDVIQLVNNWKYIQTAQTDKSIRAGKLDRNELLEGIRYVIGHEVGHCLGLMHNMGSSATIPVDSLRSPSFTKVHGTTNSIMDYARFNYVAQPGDAQRGVKLCPPSLGPYDIYAISIVYKPIFNSKGISSDYKIISKELSAAQKNPVFRYGPQQWGTKIFDPHSLTEDLGNDAMKASAYGIKNLKYILDSLNTWVKNDPDYSYRQAIYTGICYQFFNYLRHVYINLGGLYLHQKIEGDPVVAVQAVPKATQKRALEFLAAQLKNLSWLDRPDLSKNIQIMGKPSEVMRKVLVSTLMSVPTRLSRTQGVGEGGYTMPEAMEDLYKITWEPTIKAKKLDESQKDLQNAFLAMVFSNAGIKYKGDASTSPRGINDLMTYPAFLKDYANKMEFSCPIESAYDQLQAKSQTKVDNKEQMLGFGQPSLFFVNPSFNEALNYKYITKIKNLLKSRLHSGDALTQAHYALLLRNIEKSLK